MVARKRMRPNPAETTSSNDLATEPPQEPLHTTSQPDMSTPQMPSFKSASSSEQPRNGPSNQQQQVRRARSWYGSWSRPPKASAVTSVARENILGGTVRMNKAPDLSKFETRKTDDSSSLHSSSEPMAGLSGIPEDAARAPAPTDASPSPGDDKKNGEEPTQETPSDSTPLPSSTKPEEPATPQRPVTSSGWLGWLSRTPFTESQPALSSTQDPSPHPKAPEMAESGDDNRENVSQETERSSPQNTPVQQPTTPVKTLRHATSTSSWFGLWGTTTSTPQRKPTTEEATTSDGNERTDQNTTNDQPQTTTAASEPASKPGPPAASEPAPKAGATWAFWSKDSPKGKLTKQESGEIAVMGEGSEAHPKPMTEDDVSGTPSRDLKPEARTIQTSGRSTWRRSNKRVRPPSLDIESPVASPSKGSVLQPSPQTPTTSTPELVKPAASAASKAESIKSTSEAAVVQPPPNLLLPSFSSTYQLKENPSIIKQVTQLLLRTSQPPANHVFRVKDPPKIRKAIAIGVHGFFPATYLRPMIGQPTGTSLRFANLCADAIRRWADDHGCADCEIEKVALEGEGKIADRVDNLWKLMLNWIEHLRSADLIIMASHSQGVPVSIMLLEKLIDLGIITSAKIGVCAMAGVALGPFPDYKSSILVGSAAELWEFGDAQSANSQRFEQSLRRVLDYGARVTFIGSIDDQLVPMESAVYSPASHPYIYRAAFIDGRVHAPDFIAHLVGFALKLRNLGISDHGLIRELSQPLAGSLYSGEGHSRLYYDPAVYNLAVSHALETTAAAPHTAVNMEKRSAPGAPNPYVLPWIMRGLLEEDFVKTELSHETEELLRQFDDWKPTTKALKDVKYRLEAVRSRL